jgi:CheY-like chemotaxis protein
MGPGVLVVEDDPYVRVVLDELLNGQGLDVWSVGDDLSAFQVLSQEADRFRVLLTDINLGSGATGFDVARRARSLNADIKVIYITGYPLEPAKFAAEGGVLMHKPLNLAVLADMVSAAANRAH